MTPTIEPFSFPQSQTEERIMHGPPERQPQPKCIGQPEAPIEITEVRISLRCNGKLLAFATITLANALVIKGLKVIRGNTGIFVAMPGRRRPDGFYYDIAHPINPAMRGYLTRVVLDEYEHAQRMQA